METSEVRQAAPGAVFAVDMMVDGKVVATVYGNTAEQAKKRAQAVKSGCTWRGGQARPEFN